jgi:hypothetical protein
VYSITITPLAEADLREASDWYNGIRDGLGIKFVLAVDAKLNSLKNNPDHYQKRFKNVRAANLDVFPYTIHFEVMDDRIIIHSFYHHKRSITKLIQRLK